MFYCEPTYLFGVFQVLFVYVCSPSVFLVLMHESRKDFKTLMHRIGLTRNGKIFKKHKEVLYTQKLS